MANNALVWHGHANFQISTPRLEILIDPWFEGNPTAVCPSNSLDRVDLVCVSHDHQDHMGQALEICQSTGAKFLSIVETAAKMESAGLPQEQIVNGKGMNIGGTIDFQGVAITMVQAFHSSASGSPVGYIFKLEDQYTIYHAGDTGVFSSMEVLGQLYDIDLALLPAGGVFTMGPVQAALACKLLGCKKVLPMHWGTFPALEQDTSNFERQLSNYSPGTEVLVPEIGQPRPLD